ncbi:hypothetical protein pD_gene0047 [Vibrio phage 033B]|nr:hypothetical protein pD_gene0047 [Vibrio phage 033B]
MTESKTPIADQVRALELNLAEQKSQLASLHEAYAMDGEPTHIIHVITMPSLPNIQLRYSTYLTMLEESIHQTEQTIGDIEHKLTTIYAVVENCLGDSK